GRPARRSARRSRGIEWMVDGTVRGVFVRRAEGELVQVGLADEDGAGRAQPRRDDSVMHRDVTAPDSRCRAGRQPAEIDQILERDWDAVQWTAVAPSRD